MEHRRFINLRNILPWPTSFTLYLITLREFGGRSSMVWLEPAYRFVESLRLYGDFVILLIDY
jgi:hypothetical protein